MISQPTLLKVGLKENSFIELVREEMMEQMHFLSGRARRRGFGPGPSSTFANADEHPMGFYKAMREGILLWAFWFMEKCFEQDGEKKSHHRGMDQREERASFHVLDLYLQAQVILDRPFEPNAEQRRFNGSGEPNVCP